MKKWLLPLVILGVGCGGFVVWNWKKSKQTTETSGRPTTATVELRDISFAVNAAGEISPAEQVSVRPEINGKIESLPVDVGDRVKKGDLLFKLDDKELQQQRASNLTDIERARLELDKAERDFKRAQQLLNEKLIAQEVFDDTQTARDLARNALDRARKELAINEERLTKTQVLAPFDCTILTRPVSMGQAVSGSGGFNSGTEVLTIADLNSMIINALVNQADVPRLKPDQEVEVTIEAVAGLKVLGSVERIAPQASIKNNIKGFAARVVLKNVDERIRPGMTANVRIPVASAANVSAVPLAAVFTEKDPDNGTVERFVFIQQGENFERRDVKVGVADFFFAEIQEGLAPGEVVALELPKEEREKKSHGASKRRSNSGGAPNRSSNATRLTFTNAVSENPPAESRPRSRPAPGPTSRVEAPGNASSR